MINRRILLKDALVLPNAVTSAGALRGTALTRTGVARSWEAGTLLTLRHRATNNNKSEGSIDLSRRFPHSGDPARRC